MDGFRFIFLLRDSENDLSILMLHFLLRCDTFFLDDIFYHDVTFSIFYLDVAFSIFYLDVAFSTLMTFSNDSTRNIHRFCYEPSEQRHYFDDSRIIRAPADGKSPVPANKKCQWQMLHQGRKCHRGGKCRQGIVTYDQGVQCHQG